MLIPLWQKMISIFIYMLPLSTAMEFGRYLFIDFPLFQWLILPVLPIIYIQKILPLGNLILFLILFLLVIKNPKVSYFLRYNSLQAILMKIGLIIINYIFEIFLNPFGESLLIKTLSSSIFVGMIAISIFSVFECMQGKEPDLPGISNAVRIQL